MHYLRGRHDDDADSEDGLQPDGLTPPARSGGCALRGADIFRILFLIALPAFLLLTFVAPLRSGAPSRDELRDALRSLDADAYAQSGCVRVEELAARCEATRACDKLYYQQLRNFAKNCHTISTKELERCLLTTTGGKCIFEHLEQYCERDIASVLECHLAKMVELLAHVLSPPYDAGGDGRGGGGDGGDSAAVGEAAFWAAAAAGTEKVLDLVTLSDWPSTIVSWALDSESGGGDGIVSTPPRFEPSEGLEGGTGGAGSAGSALARQ